MKTGDADAVRKGLRGLLGEESVSEGYVRLRIGVLEAQAAVLAALGARNVGTVSGRARGQHGVLDGKLAPVDAQLARGLFESIVTACRQDANPGEDLRRLESAVAGRPVLVEELMRGAAFAGGEEDVTRLAGRLEVSLELVVFAGRLLAAPFVRHAVLAQFAHGTGTAAEGTCPACGSTPGLASLRADDGGRMLHCSLCGHVWPFGRLDCPFCTGGDESALTRLEVGDDVARWIEACDGCRHYLKVIDRRRLGDGHEFIPLVEEVAGLYLDLVAEGEGFHQNPPYAAAG